MAPTHPDPSSERLAAFPFKPVDTEPKMSQWPGEYIAKRNSVATKRAAMSSGLEIAYFEDRLRAGDSAGHPWHGLLQGAI